MSTLISCIIPAYQAEQFLSRAVHSLLDTNYEPLEILIINDGSTDGTHQTAESLVQSQATQVKLLQHQRGANRGVSASRNLGLAEATGEWICFLDADDYVYPDRFELAVEILRQQPEVDGVHEIAEMVFSSSEAEQQWWQGNTRFGFTEPVTPEDLIMELLKGRCWATSAILFRKSLLEQTGNFDLNKSIAEDCHLWFRMAMTGRLVQGDLNRNVSAYWRHNQSAYQPTDTHRLHMNDAMLSFYQWAKKSVPGDSRLPQIRAAIKQYLMQGVIQARSKRNRALARQIARKAAVSFPELNLEWKFQRQIAHLMLGR